MPSTIVVDATFVSRPVRMMLSCSWLRSQVDTNMLVAEFQAREAQMKLITSMKQQQGQLLAAIADFSDLWKPANMGGIPKYTRAENDKLRDLAT
eukprot:2901826-Prymnesium_polylepis.2